MKPLSLILAALTAASFATFAGCGNTTYEIHPDPSSIGGGGAAEDSNEILPAADGNDETPSKIKELEAKIDELTRQMAEQAAEPSDPAPATDPTPVPDPAPEQPTQPEASAPEFVTSVSDSVIYAPGTVSAVPRCGDGRLDRGETCDDGNVAGWDGCTFCNVDAEWECDQGSPSVCHPKETSYSRSGGFVDQDSAVTIDPMPKMEAKKDIVLPANPPSNGEEDPPKLEAAKESRLEATPTPPPPPEGSVYYAGSDDQPPWKRAQ